MHLVGAIIHIEILVARHAFGFSEVAILAFIDLNCWMKVGRLVTF